MQAMIQSQHSFQPNAVVAAAANGGDSDASNLPYVGISWALSRGLNEELTKSAFAHTDARCERPAGRRGAAIDVDELCPSAAQRRAN